MNWYKKAQYKKSFVGNCISGLDDPYFQNNIADDATTLSNIVEGASETSYEQFLKITDIHPDTIGQIQYNPNNYSFYYNDYFDIAFYRNENEDVEYFYK